MKVTLSKISFDFATPEGTGSLMAPLPGELQWELTIPTDPEPPEPERLTGLVGYWKMDEASGDRVDVHGGHNLLPQGTVSAAAGKLNQALSLAGSGSLSIASAPALQTGDIDFSVALWVRLDSKGAEAQIFGKTGGGGDEWGIKYVLATDRFAFFIRDVAMGYPHLLASSLGSPAVGTWYFIAAWHSATFDVINISVNAGAVDTMAVSNGSPVAGSESLRVGGYGPSANLLTGLVDEVQFRKNYLWTTQDLNYFYGAGTPPAYPFP